MTYPSIIFERKEFFEVGCVRCRVRNNWQIYSDKITFVAKCGCDHTTKLIIKEDNGALGENK